MSYSHGTDVYPIKSLRVEGYFNTCSFYELLVYVPIAILRYWNITIITYCGTNGIHYSKETSIEWAERLRYCMFSLNMLQEPSNMTLGLIILKKSVLKKTKKT